MPAVNPCLHFATLEQQNTILSLNSIPPSLLITLPPFPNCYLTTFPSLRPCHITILPPFHLIPLIHFSHFATSLVSYTFPTFPAEYSPTFPSSFPTTNRPL